MKLKIPRIIKNFSLLKGISYSTNYVLNPSGQGRRYAVQSKPECWNLVFSLFGLAPHLEEPIYKNFIGNNFLEGAYVKEHTDPSPKGFDHIRINYMIKKPNIGGDPVIDGELLTVSEEDLWICIANRERHGSTPISGGERLIYSFGSLIPVSQTENLL